MTNDGYLEGTARANSSLVPGETGWLDAEAHRLLDFTERAFCPTGGFGWQDEFGEIDAARPTETWITTRVVHILSIGHLLGRPSCARLVDHGLDALEGLLHDDEHGGWFGGADRPNAGRKGAYDHAFVILAAASAEIAGRPTARPLFDKALAVFDLHFWDDTLGVCRESFSQDWTEREPYVGANANMHAIESFMAAAIVTGDESFLDRTVRITDFFINGHARENNWRIPEHYDDNLSPVLDYNIDEPAHLFRPYGATVGRGFEWAKLCCNLGAALGERAPKWLEESALELFDRSVQDGWQTDGFVYTTDWSGTPVVTQRLQWVLAEAISAASVLHRVTGETKYHDQFEQWSALAEAHFIDRTNGAWHAQLDEANQPASTMWKGKPDTCHATHAMLTPRLPLAPITAAALRDGLLDSP